MSALATIDPGVATVRQTLSDLLDSIARSTDTGYLLDAQDRIKLAREWAKIHKRIGELHQELLRAEIACLRRIAQLGAVDVLPPHARSAAGFFGQLADSQIEHYLTEYGARSTAVGVHRAIEKESGRQAAIEFGRDLARGKISIAGEDEIAERISLEEIVFSETENVRTALAVLLEHYASRSFTIAEMADEVLLSAGISAEHFPHFADIRQGVSEVCRSAVRSAPVVTVEDYLLPAFVTCANRRVEGFVRVPFAVATLGQLGEMVALRRKQLEEDERAYGRLVKAYQALATGCANGCCAALNPDEPMGEPFRLCNSRKSDLAA